MRAVRKGTRRFFVHVTAALDTETAHTTVQTPDLTVPKLDGTTLDPSISGPSRTPFVPISTHHGLAIVVRTWTGPDLGPGPLGKWLKVPDPLPIS